MLTKVALFGQKYSKNSNCYEATERGMRIHMQSFC